MIRLSGTNDDKQNLESYRTKFIHYAKRRVYECPAIISNLNPANETELHVKLDSKYDNCTVAELEEFQSRLCMILRRKVYAIRLLSMEKGCFKLVYAISDYSANATFPLSEEQESKLADLGILQLTCNDYQLKTTIEVREYGTVLATCHVHRIQSQWSVFVNQHHSLCLVCIEEASWQYKRRCDAGHITTPTSNLRRMAIISL